MKYHSAVSLECYPFLHWAIQIKVILSNRYMTINPGKKASLVILPFWMKQMLTNSGEKEKSVSSKVKDSELQHQQILTGGNKEKGKRRLDYKIIHTASKHVYYLGWNRSPAQVGCMRQALGPGALGRPRGSWWRGRWEGGSGWGTHVNPWLFHFNVWQNPLQIKKK